MIGLVSRVFTNGLGDLGSIPGRVIPETIKMVPETDCISHSTNTLGKGMNPIILPPAMGK